MQMQTFTPQLSAQMPSTWSTNESFSLIAPAGFPNVIVSTGALPPGTPVQSVEEQGASLRRDLPDYVERSLSTAPFLGEEAHLRHYEWVARNGLPITQLQLYLVSGAREYTATATAVAADFGSQEALLRRMLASVRRDGRTDAG